MPYNHAYTIAFTVITDDPTGADTTAEQFDNAIRERCDDLMIAEEMVEAIGLPFDSYKEE